MQFGRGFRRFGALRRRRNELEHPQPSGDEATFEEAEYAVESAQATIAAVAELFDEVGLF